MRYTDYFSSRGFKNQNQILKLINNGWEFGKSKLTGECWIEEGGIGSGGNKVGIHGNMFNSLYKKGIILSTGTGFPVELFKLSEIKLNETS